MVITKEKALDIIDRFDLFQGQRAGRELWNDKPYNVQEEDIRYFAQGCKLLRDYISNCPDASPRTSSRLEKRLKEQTMKTDKQAIEEMAEIMCDDCLSHFPKCARRVCDAVLQQAEVIYKAGYRKQSENAEEFDDLIINFDEMGFQPTTTVPDPEGYAIEWRNKLINTLKGYRKQSVGEWEFTVNHSFNDWGDLIVYATARCSECKKEYPFNPTVAREFVERPEELSYSDDWDINIESIKTEVLKQAKKNKSLYSLCPHCGAKMKGGAE